MGLEPAPILIRHHCGTTVPRHRPHTSSTHAITNLVTPRQHNSPRHVDAGGCTAHSHSPHTHRTLTAHSPQRQSGEAAERPTRRCQVAAERPMRGARGPPATTRLLRRASEPIPSPPTRRPRSPHSPATRHQAAVAQWADHVHHSGRQCHATPPSGPVASRPGGSGGGRWRSALRRLAAPAHRLRQLAAPAHALRQWPLRPPTRSVSGRWEGPRWHPPARASWAPAARCRRPAAPEPSPRRSRW